MWSTKTKVYFIAYSLSKVVESSLEPPLLPNNSTVAQIRQYNEVAKEGEALIIIRSIVSDDLFTRIITCQKAKEAWDKS